MKTKDYWKFSVFLVSPVLSILYFKFQLAQYVVLDDIYLHNITASAGAHSEQLVCSGVILGYLLKFLYSLFPQLNWYSLFQVLFLNIIVTSLLCVFFRHKHKWLSYSFVFLIECYSLARMTFTSLALIGAITAIIWYFEYVRSFEKKTIPHVIYVIVLLIFSFSFRNSSVLYLTLLMAAPLAFVVIKNKWNKSLVACLVLAICLVCSFAVKETNAIYNSFIPEDTYYNQFQEYRGQAYDGGLIDYQLHKECFSEADISDNDIQLFQSAMFADKNVFTDNFLKTIAENRSFNEKFNLNIFEIIKNIIFGEAKVQNFTVLFALLALLLLIITKDKRLELFVISFFVSGAIGYLHLRRRGLPRVTNVIAIIGIILLLYIFVQSNNILYLNRIKLKNAKLRNVLCCILIVSVVAGYSALMYRQEKVESVDYSTVESYIDENSDYIYTADSWSASGLHNHKLTVLESDFDHPPVILPYGTWYLYSYYWYDNMEQSGLTNYSDSAIKALLDDRVLFVSANVLPESIVSYFQEHYNLFVDYKAIKQFDSGIVIYDFDEIE